MSKKLETLAATEKQVKFVDCYFKAGCKRSDAGRLFDPNNKRPSAIAYNYLKQPIVQELIKRRQEKGKLVVNITEKDVLDQMWEEATFSGPGSQHSARITALLKFSEMMGFFKETMNDKGSKSELPPIQIVNYGDAEVKAPDGTTIKTKELIENTDEKDITDAIQIIDGIKITEY